MVLGRLPASGAPVALRRFSVQASGRQPVLDFNLPEFHPLQAELSTSFLLLLVRHLLLVAMHLFLAASCRQV